MLLHALTRGVPLVPLPALGHPCSAVTPASTASLALLQGAQRLQHTHHAAGLRSARTPPDPTAPQHCPRGLCPKPGAGLAPAAPSQRGHTVSTSTPSRSPGNYRVRAGPVTSAAGKCESGLTIHWVPAIKTPHKSKVLMVRCRPPSPCPDTTAMGSLKQKKNPPSPAQQGWGDTSLQAEHALRPWAAALCPRQQQPSARRCGHQRAAGARGHTSSSHRKQSHLPQCRGC